TVKEKREADLFRPHGADDHLGKRPGPEKRLTNIVLSGDHRVRQLFILGERRDHPQDRRDVGDRRRLDTKVAGLFLHLPVNSSARLPASYSFRSPSTMTELWTETARLVSSL